MAIRKTARTDGIAGQPWLPAALMACASLIFLVILEARPIDPHEAAGIFPPWWSQGAVIAAASQAGAVVAGGRSPFVIIVRSSTPDVAARLHRAGALFSIDPGRALACGA